MMKRWRGNRKAAYERRSFGHVGTATLMKMLEGCIFASLYSEWLSVLEDKA